MNKDFAQTLDAFIKIGLLLILVMWCFSILKPFVAPVIWAVIIAVTIMPSCRALANKLGGSNKMSAGLITIVLLTILILPVVLMGNMLFDDATKYAAMLEKDDLSVPPPKESVKEWPLVGEAVYSFWDNAADNLAKALSVYEEQIRNTLQKGLSLVTGLAGSLLLFIFATIISGILMVNGDSASGLANRLARRLSAKSGEKLVASTAQTVRNVTKGILGVALIQAIFATIGLLVMDIPGAPIISVAVLILAIVQLSPGLVLLPVCIYVFSGETSTVWASIYLVYNLVVSMMDTVLKPILMGKGSSIPTIVIFLGAIGGLLLHGMVGLFIGAVVLVVSYELLVDWLEQDAKVNAEINEEVNEEI